MWALASADRDSQLSAIAASPACAAGRVLTIDFSVIRRRLGDVWTRKRDYVWAIIEKIIARHSCSKSLALRVDETEYMVCFSEGDREAAKKRGGRILRESLKYFLGEYAEEDVAIFLVAEIVNGVISRTPIEAEVGQAASPNTRTQASLPDLPPILIEGGGDRLTLTLSLQDLVALRERATIGQRLAGILISERTSRRLASSERPLLPTRTLAQIDREVLAAALGRVRDGSAPTILCPLSMQALSTARSRLPLLHELNSLTGPERERLCVELTGAVAGTPVSRLTEMRAILKAFCRRIVLQTPLQLAAAQTTSDFGALSVSASDLGEAGDRLAAGLLAFGQAAQDHVGGLIATDLPSRDFLPVCHSAGFAIGSVSTDGHGSPTDRAPPPEDL